MSRFLVFCFFAAFAAAQEREPGKGINFYSIEKEIALGKQLAAEFQRDTKPLESPVALTYIRDIGQRLVAQIGGPPFNYTFALVADDPTVLHDVAAFPGGFLFIPASPTRVPANVVIMGFGRHCTSSGPPAGGLSAIQATALAPAHQPRFAVEGHHSESFLNVSGRVNGIKSARLVPKLVHPHLDCVGG